MNDIIMLIFNTFFYYISFASKVLKSGRTVAKCQRSLRIFAVSINLVYRNFFL